MAIFNYDNLGSSITKNSVRLTSPIFDNSNDISSTLEIDFNFRDFLLTSDTFFVEVFDGTKWNTHTFVNR